MLKELSLRRNLLSIRHITIFIINSLRPQILLDEINYCYSPHSALIANIWIWYENMKIMLGLFQMLFVPKWELKPSTNLIKSLKSKNIRLLLTYHCIQMICMCLGGQSREWGTMTLNGISRGWTHNVLPNVNFSPESGS